LEGSDSGKIYPSDGIDAFYGPFMLRMEWIRFTNGNESRYSGLEFSLWLEPHMEINPATHAQNSRQLN
jgi:hypothetical protein